MLIMASIVRVGQSRFVAVPIDEDSQERILNCVQTLAQLEDSKPANAIFLEDTKAAYAKMVSTAERKAAEKKAKESKTNQVQADDQIVFRQFSKKPLGGDVDEVRKDAFSSILTHIIGLLIRALGHTFSSDQLTDMILRPFSPLRSSTRISRGQLDPPTSRMTSSRSSAEWYSSLVRLGFRQPDRP